MNLLQQLREVLLIFKIHDKEGVMNEKIKTWVSSNYMFIIGVIAIICCLFLFIGRITSDNGSSDINTTGISNAERELESARQGQSRAVEQNRDARESITNSITLNERASEAISHSEEYNKRTEQAIKTSQSEFTGAKELIRKNTKLITESRGILESAKARNR